MSSPIAPDRIEALLRGEGGSDADERRIAALLDELALGAVSAPDALRERVLAHAAPSVAPRRRRLSMRLPGTRWTRLGSALAAAAAVGGVAFVLQGRPETSRTQQSALKPAAAAAPTRDKTAAHTFGGTTLAGVTADQLVARQALEQADATSGAASAAPRALAPLPQVGRAQDYQASMRVAVGDGDALSRRTAEVIRATRAFGGAVASTDFQLPASGQGHSYVDLRVPVARAQDALARFSSLGRIVGQRIAIEDLQPAVDRQSNRVRALRRKVALAEAKLLDPSLSATGRAELEASLADARVGLDSVLRGLRTTQTRAASARFSLELVTSDVAAPATQRDGAFTRTAGRALAVLGTVGRAALYLAIVAGPFLVVTLLGGLAYRRTRRRADRRLLEEA